MEETFSASTESATPADSSVVDTSATSASGTGAGEQPSQSESVATAPETATDQIDPGWSLDDEPENALPENDDDLEAMQNEPGLDPARTPGLVEAVRKARQAARDNAQAVGQFRQQIAAFEPFGGIEGATQTLNLVSSLISNPAEGGIPFLSQLRQEAAPAYDEIASLMAFNDPDILIQKLQEYGKLPNITPQQSSSITAEDLAAIPQHLQAVAKALPPNVFDDLMQQSEEVRNHNLERELKLQNMDAQQRQVAETQWKAQVEQAQTAGRSAVETLSQQFEQGHYSRLSKWQPFGPNSPQNEIVHKLVVNGAHAELQNDPKFAQMAQDAINQLYNAPLRRLHGEGMAAQQDEQRARGLAAQYNARLGQIIKERVQLMDGVFRDARSFRESQQQQASNRTEIAGGAVSMAGNGVRAIGPDGRATAEWKQRLAASLPDFG